MKLTHPIYRLKRIARQKARQTGLPLSQALNELAVAEGFTSWSNLASVWRSRGPAEVLLDRFREGNLILLAARPGQGKTLLGLELAATASVGGRNATFFSSECSETDVQRKLTESGFGTPGKNTGPAMDLTDCVCARHIISRLDHAPRKTIAVIDYLQVMDQDRREPPLGEQIVNLRRFARDRGHTIVFLSQVHRSFDPKSKPLPDFEDLRTTNPVDLSLFDAGCFLHDGELVLRSCPADA